MHRGFFQDSSSPFSLRDINFSLKQGDLVACVGSVGSGKSSLLLAILDQMPITSGGVSVDGDIAYVPQEAWVFSGTFRENLLFGCPMDQARYDETISMCSLKPDIDLMPSGDLSLVGERGLSLSGGQKTRLNLARAVYRNADVYLLDDPLSAVDSKVGNHLFQKCIRGYLGDKTRLLVTHQLQYLKDVDQLIVLQDGLIHAMGTFGELEGRVDFSHHLEQNDKQQTVTEQRVPGLFADKVSLISCKTDKSQKEADVDQSDVEVIGVEDAEQIEEEERLKGTVEFSVYRQYWQAGKGWLLFTILLVIAVANKTVFVFVDWSNWFINDYESLYNVSNHEDDFVPSESYDFLYVYISLVAGLLLFSIAEAVVHVLFTRFAARNLHDAMFSIVMRAPLKFFERNPVGRVLNRFSRDMIFIDELLPQQAFFVLINLMMALATVVFVSIVNPWVLLFTLPLVIAVIFIRKYGMRTTREIKRIEALNRSPVFSHLTASLQGMSVIRAYKMEAAMTKHFDQLQDKHTASWFLFICSYRWLGVRFDAMTGIYLCCAVYAGLLLADRQSVNGTLIGLSLGYIFSLLGVLQYVMRITAELESHMTSVERILQYTNLDQEALPHTKMPLPDNWPTNGDICFEHVTVAYNENSCPALNDVCVNVTNGQKIGVVGRTGAGKSTFMMALMRLVEPKGSIWIDGVDITTIGLHDLRKNVAIIPQDPVMFTGTLRVNLDPFSEYRDEELWQVLEEVQLKEKVELLQGQLYGSVTEGGSNFSVGQKQLVCLARAILRRNKIVLIDEATANVDQATDELIQKMLRTKFSDCTVITIAHRLDTIIDSDKVLVLEQGEVREFDHPFTLLQNKKGDFYAMVRQTGSSYSGDLLMAAKIKYDRDVAAGLCE